MRPLTLVRRVPAHRPFAPMPELLVLLAVVAAVSSGVPGLFADPRGPARQGLATALLITASVLGLLALVLPALPLALPGATWGLSAWVGLDALQRWFFVPLLVLPPLCAVYGGSYWRQQEQPGTARKLRLFFGLMVGAMLLLVAARNAVLFLVAWETMALAAFFLVSTQDDDPEVQTAGWHYLVATHAGTLCLFAVFALMRQVSGTFALGPLPAENLTPGMADALFLLALVGFGFKAGLLPLHVWLPGAHANAPGHVSALLSGVMLKMGVFGLLRVTGWLPPGPAWWGGLVLTLGAAGALYGIAMAIGQRDLKRLLAWSSIENLGIVAMGLGLALLGRTHGADGLVALGLGAALLHVWNHGIFKSMLFLAAGSVLHATGTRNMASLGGLAKTMPHTTVVFLVGGLAISGLPPLNGFVGELCLYLGLFQALVHGDDLLFVGAAAAATALALVGALAVAAFVQAVGLVFLGEPRSPAAEHAHEADRQMLGPMAVLAGLCVLLGIAPVAVAPLVDTATSAWLGRVLPAEWALAQAASFGPLAVGAALLLVLGAGLAWFLHRRIARNGVEMSGTWGCGYAAPTARMQYTPAAFSQILVSLLRQILRPRVQRPDARTDGPGQFLDPPGRFQREVDDALLDRVLLPAAESVARAFSTLRILQSGRTQAYFLYMIVTLCALLLWR